MKQLKITTTASAIVTLDGLDVDDVIRKAADLAHEAPEKLYIHKSQFWGLMANEHNITKDGIEYIRADAFIEKACEWIKENITNNPNANSVLVRNGCVTLGMLIKDFKNYMKGE